MIKLGTQQLGNKLVRVFGEGEKLKRVVSETIDGKTFTHVYDRSGNPIKSRVSTTSVEQVGNKTVRTKNEVIKNFCDLSETKFRKDRVYGSGNEFLGERSIMQYNFDGKSIKVVDKYLANSRYITSKKFHNGHPIERNISGKSGGWYGSCSYNDKGLPIPNGGIPEQYKGMPLREMRAKYFADPASDKYPYVLGPGMDKLNILDAELIPPVKDTEALNSSLGSLLDKIG